MTPQMLRVILFLFLAVIYLASLLYLGRRKMPVVAYIFWGIFALLLPAIGPFFVIAYRPGERRRGVRGSTSKKTLHKFWKSELT
jgi:hypothetical protein